MTEQKVSWMSEMLIPCVIALSIVLGSAFAYKMLGSTDRSDEKEE